MKQIIKEYFLPPAAFHLIQRIKVLIGNARYSAQIDKENNDVLKNAHVLERCFVVGTGPSINNQDLTLLKNDFVIGVSGLFQHKDIDSLSPEYYVLPPVFRGHGENFDENDFISMLQDMDASLDSSTVLFLDVYDKKYIEKYNIFRKKTIKWLNYLPWRRGVSIGEIKLLEMPSIVSVSEVAIQIAIYLGFKEIYLLGFDHSWQTGIFNHFNDDYNKYYDEKKLNKIIKRIDSEHEMERHALMFNKYKALYRIKENIFNANANLSSYVDTFPKVRFDDLFN